MTIIGTGVDITEVNRLRKAVEKWGDSFLQRIFTDTELSSARTRSSMYQHLAGRFAAKEAIFKAMGDKHLAWHDVEISNDAEGKPHCAFLNGRNPRNRTVHISISHVKSYAVASAVVEQK
jgi:holo-[acyl-carrier protein] synthase